MIVRLARVEDSVAVAEIYDQGVLTRTAEFEVPPQTPAGEQEATGTPPDRYPVLVAEDVDGEIMGWAALSEHSTRACYQGIADCSVYVETSHRGRGVGTALSQSLVEEATRLGYWKLISRVFVSNEASRALCRNAGFREVGVLERHGRLEGRWMDVLIVERLIPENQH